MKTIIASVFFILYSAGIFGQAVDEAGYKQLKTNKLGFGTGMVHNFTESEWAPTFHLHYSKCIDQKQRFSIGGGMDFLLGDHKHISASLAVEYCPIPGFSIGYGPGIELALGSDTGVESPIGGDEDRAIHFNQHFELSYEFDLGFMQIGPMIEYEFSGDDKNIMLGLHTGINF